MEEKEVALRGGKVKVAKETKEQINEIGIPN